MQTISQRITADCQAFIDKANQLSEDEFRSHIGEKWSVADVMQHLYLSARPVVKVMMGPREVLTQWGMAETPTRTYEQLVIDYDTVLSKGVKAPTPFVPRPEDVDAEKQVMIDRFIAVYRAVNDELVNWSEQELDEYCMLHPALGKLTVREMLYFISIHTQHHLRLL
ncbi:DinB family protein [Spirosoma gilvum]